MVLSTALFDSPPFKHVIVNGLVLAAGKTRAIWHFLAVYAYERYPFFGGSLGHFRGRTALWKLGGSKLHRGCFKAASFPCLFLE